MGDSPVRTAYSTTASVAPPRPHQLGRLDRRDIPGNPIIGDQRVTEGRAKRRRAAVPRECKRLVNCLISRRLPRTEAIFSTRIPIPAVGGDPGGDAEWIEAPFAPETKTMSRSPLRDFLSALVVALIALQPADAVNAETVIYKSTDAKGHVSYGDAPLSSAVTVEEIRLPTAPPVDAAELQTRLEGVIATTDRLHSDRMEREKRRAAESEPAVPPAALPEFYPQYHISRGPWFAPSPFRERQWRYPHSPRPWGYDRYQPQQPPPNGLGPRPPHRSSILRSPPGR